MVEGDGFGRHADDRRRSNGAAGNEGAGMTPSSTNKDALREFVDNLKAVPRRVYQTAFRGGPPTTDRTRSTFVFGNVFLHLHSVRTHRWSLRCTSRWAWAS
jgi:hypothetical protein